MRKFQDEYTDRGQKVVEERDIACGHTDSKKDEHITQRDEGRSVLGIEPQRDRVKDTGRKKGNECKERGNLHDRAALAGFASGCLSLLSLASPGWAVCLCAGGYVSCCWL